MTAPDGMSVDASSGLIEWAPAREQVGEHAVTVRVVDESGLEARQDFRITVTPLPTGEAPEITSVALHTVEQTLPQRRGDANRHEGVVYVARLDGRIARENLGIDLAADSDLRQHPRHNGRQLLLPVGHANGGQRRAGGDQEVGGGAPVDAVGV